MISHALPNLSHFKCHHLEKFPISHIQTSSTPLIFTSNTHTKKCRKLCLNSEQSEIKYCNSVISIIEKDFLPKHVQERGLSKCGRERERNSNVRKFVLKLSRKASFRELKIDRIAVKWREIT